MCEVRGARSCVFEGPGSVGVLYIVTTVLLNSRLIRPRFKDKVTIDIIVFVLRPAFNFIEARRFGSQLFFRLQAMKTPALVDPLGRATSST